MPNVGPIRDPVCAILRGFKGPGINTISGPFVGSLILGGQYAQYAQCWAHMIGAQYGPV